jgi:hypothetical protein
MEPVQGPFGPAHPEEVLTIPQSLMQPPVPLPEWKGTGPVTGPLSAAYESLVKPAAEMAISPVGLLSAPALGASSAARLGAGLLFGGLAAKEGLSQMGSEDPQEQLKGRMLLASSPLMMAGPRLLREKTKLPEEVITASTYTNPETDVTTTAPNHIEAAAKQGVEAPQERTARETPEYGFEVQSPDKPPEVVTRKEGEKVAEESGQLIEKPKTGELHSDEVASPVQPDKPLGDVPQPQISEGPGAASPGDQPAAPRQAIAAAAPIESGPTSNRPFGAVSSMSVAINNARNTAHNVVDFIKGVAGESMPKTTRTNRELGETGVRYAASRIASEPLSKAFSSAVLRGTDVEPVKFGAALTEDNLRSVRESLRQKASEALASGKPDDAQVFNDQADNVATIIGSKGSPFETEDQYFDFLNEPSTKQAVKQHIQLWQEVIDPQYRAARDIDPDVELPSRGQQTGARVNLKALFPEEEATTPVTGGANLTGTFKRRTPFAIKAKGTGDVYDINYNNLILNTFERQLEIANKNRFDNKLVETGNAVIDSPGKRPTINGEPTRAFPISRRVLISRGPEGPEAFSQAKNIYVRQSLANEYESAAGVGTRWNLGPVTKVMNLLNRAALSGLTDATTHVSNQMTALFDRPASAKLLSDTLLSATGRADVPVTLTRAIMKGFKDNEKQVAELSEIGAMRSQAKPHMGVFGRWLQKSDQITRLVLDDTFKRLAESGLVENTETARREYVNQIGQYNKRLQGKLTRFFRETGFGPFVTAGKTFNSLGVRMATLDPGAPASNAFASAALRANVLSKWIGAAVLLGSLNYLLTKDKGGGVMGRRGTPIGNLDLGTNDKSGKQQSFPLFSVLGLGRGLRVTGLSGAINAERLGLTDADAANSAARDIINAWVSPFAGPTAKFVTTAATGYPTAVNVGRLSRIVPPGENQFAENTKEAILQSSPLVQTYIKAREGKTVPEILSSQLPRFVPSSGKTPEMVEKYPKIVSLAQGGAFIDDMIHQARQLPREQRRAFVTEQIKRLPESQREHAFREVHRRRVYTN